MLTVVFGRTTPLYSPGEVLTGDVVISSSTQCKILDLTVNYCGVSSVSFLVSEGRGKDQTCKSVEETDVHLDVLHPLVKSYRGVPITPGVHTYPFSLQLPRLLPSAYKSPYGHISYYVHVHLQTSVATLDVRKPYTIVAPVNVNLFRSTQNPQSIEVLQRFGLFSRKTLRLKASVFKACFVPGEVIPVVVEVDNETSRQPRYLFCTLKQITNVQVHCQDETLSRVTKQCLVTIAHKMLPSEDGIYSWRCQLPSPSNLTPTIAASTIVFVTYCIQVSVKIKRVPIPPEVQIPVVFGVRAKERRNRDAALENCSAANTPTVTNPRRRITVCVQPHFYHPKKLNSQFQINSDNCKRRLSTVQLPSRGTTD